MNDVLGQIATLETFIATHPLINEQTKLSMHQLSQNASLYAKGQFSLEALTHDIELIIHDISLLVS